jgi:serine/threonine-protein kinase
VRARKALAERDWPTLEPFARAAEVEKHPLSFLLIVARSFPAQMKSSRLELFRKIQRTYPADLWANYWLAHELQTNGRPAEAIRYCTAMLALRPDNPGIYLNRGAALNDAGELDAAIADYRHALALAPQYVAVHYNLGVTLAKSLRFAEAVVEFREYFREAAGDAATHYNFGYALSQNGQQDEAIIELRQAIRLKKDFPRARLVLVQVLGMKGRLEEAIVELHEAIRYDSEEGEYHFWLGKALKDLGRLDEGVIAYREAIRLKTAYPEAHRKRDPDLAIAPYKWLGAEAHCELGHVLRQQGEVREALEKLRRGHELGSKSPGWPYPSAEWVRECERLVELDGKLPDYVARKTTPASPSERVQLAELCSLKRLNGAAARFFSEAFTAEPKLAEDLRALHRYNAACAAALAGCGQGKDADQSNVQERVRLRGQALDWLRADLVAWGRLLEQQPDKIAPALTNMMQPWQQDPDFAGVRGPEALAKLPDAERQAWQKLWKDVAAMLKQAQEQTAAEKK